MFEGISINLQEHCKAITCSQRNGMLLVCICIALFIPVMNMKTSNTEVLFLLFPAPAAAPQNPSSTTLNATAIQVQWEQVPEIDRNGEIIYYEVRVDPAQFQSISDVNVSGAELEVMVDGLEEFVQYNFTLRAYTSAGPGPFSNVTTNTTDQAGEVLEQDNHHNSSQFFCP